MKDLTRIQYFFLLCCVIICTSLSKYSHCQNGRPFQSGNIFKTNYFIINNGQFDQFNQKGITIKYAVDNGNDHIYFSNSGWVWHLKKNIIDSSKHNSLKESEKEENKKDEGEVKLSWLNTLFDCNIEGIEKSEHYFTYGGEKLNSYGYKKIIYHDLYPNIDLEYVVSDFGGIKYTLILNDSADISFVKMRFTGKNIKLFMLNDSLVIGNDIRDIVETGLTVIDSLGNKIASRYIISGNEVSFKLEKANSYLGKITIDPWLKQINSLTNTITNSLGNNKGYDVDFDNRGNLYVYGAGYPNNPNSIDEFYKVAKYDLKGVLKWTFQGSVNSIGWYSYAMHGYASNFVVDKVQSKTYIGQGEQWPGAQIVRLNDSGAYDNFVTTGSDTLNEIWDMQFNCSNGQIIALGGGLGGAWNGNIGIVNINKSLTFSNFTGLNNCCQDVVTSYIDKNSDVYVLLTSYFSVNASIKNHIFKLNSNYNDTIWDSESGFDSFDELDNKPYLGQSASNGFNGICVNNKYLFYYDGFNLKAFDKSLGDSVGKSIRINNFELKQQGGIYADDCNNVYIGGNNGNIKVFYFNGNTFASRSDVVFNGMQGKKIFDIKYNPNIDMLYVCGDSMVATLYPTMTCLDTTIKLSGSWVCKSNPIVKILNFNPNNQYSIVWIDKTTNTTVKSINSVSATDTLFNWLANHEYNVQVIKNPNCNGILHSITIKSDFFINSIVKYICTGDSLEINKRIYKNTGQYIDTFINNQNCIEIMVLNLYIVAPSYDTIYDTICEGYFYKIGNHRYDKTGVYIDSLINLGGCDSVIKTFLVVLPKSNTIQTISICIGDTFYFNSHKYTLAGIYIDTLVNYNGCDSIIETKLFVRQKYYMNNNISICEGESLQIGNHIYKIAGIYVDSLYTFEGCDSIIKTNLVIKTIYQVSHQKTICYGETLKVGSHEYSATGVYIDTLISSVFCDSIVTTKLFVSPKIIFNESISLCKGENYFCCGSIKTISGIYYDTLTSYSGCDSVVVYNITFGSKPITNFDYNPKDIEIGKEIYFNDQSTNAHLRFWTFKSDLINDSIYVINPIYIFSHAIRYLVQLRTLDTVTNCFDSLVKEIFVKYPKENYIPNAFTPNNNGINDRFIPYITGYSDVHMKIYNRWGEKLYEVKFDSNQPNIIKYGWDGFYMGKICSQDEYIYILELKNDFDENSKLLFGSFILLR